MARKRGFIAELQHQSQQAEKRRRQQAAVAYRAQVAAQREADRSRLASERARAAAMTAAVRERDQLEKEAARLHVESQVAETGSRNADLVQVFEEIDGILAATFGVDDYIDLESLKITTVNHPPFRPGQDGTPTPPGVEVAIGDLLDPVSVEKAMHGVDKLYLLNAVSPDELTQALIAYDLAKKLKLKHIVYHSVFRVEHFKDVPHFASKLAIENALREFEVPFTIIRPNYFIQNDATLKDALMAGIYPMPLGNIGISVVDIRDIAEGTAIVLTSEEHNGKTHNLNGPKAISGPKAASIWSQLLGKDIRYAGHDMDAFEEQMRKQTPSWSAFDIRMMFQGYLERGFVAEPEDVEKLTKLLGHAPSSYEDFAAETAALWKL